MPWLLPPGGSDNVILFLRINILTGIKFFRKEWKVVDFFSFFSCVGNCPPLSGENAVVVVDFFFFFPCVGTKAPPAAKMPWGCGCG